jgi:hypothetical protein
MAFFTVVQLSRWPRISPFFHLAQCSPAALHPIPKAAPTPFWENFLRDQTHPAGCSLFYTLLLFVRVFVGLVYGGPDCPGCRTAFFYLWLLFTIDIELVLPAPVR